MAQLKLQDEVGHGVFMKIIIKFFCFCILFYI